MILYSILGVYKPANITGGPHIVESKFRMQLSSRVHSAHALKVTAMAITTLIAPR